jgi:hypothetical protein
MKLNIVEVGMNRIWMLLAFVFLIAGCSQPEAVVDNDASGKELSAVTEKATERIKETDAEITLGETDAPSSAAESKTETAESISEEPSEEVMTPAEELRELRKRSAATEEFFEFVAKYPSSEEAFDALKRIAREKISGDDKTRLMELLDEQFFAPTAEIDDSTSLEAAMVMLSLTDEDSRDQMIERISEKFIAARDSLDAVTMKALSSLIPSVSSELRGQLLGQVVDNFADDVNILRLVRQMERGVPKPEVENFLKGIVEKSNDDQVKGTTMVSLAKYYVSIPDFQSFVEDERFVRQFPDSVDYIKEYDPVEHADEIEGLLKRVAEKFADVEAARGKTLGELAEAELFVINYLSVGKEAPDIVGEDLDGESFKLSDYRGKVVMLDFWGDW